jgi:hypothetical protein
MIWALCDDVQLCNCCVRELLILARTWFAFGLPSITRCDNSEEDRRAQQGRAVDADLENGHRVASRNATRRPWASWRPRLGERSTWSGQGTLANRGTRADFCLVAPHMTRGQTTSRDVRGSRGLGRARRAEGAPTVRLGSRHQSRALRRTQGAGRRPTGELRPWASSVEGQRRAGAASWRGKQRRAGRRWARAQGKRAEQVRAP